MFHQSPTWRFIPPLEVSGKIQMAIDYWLLQQHHLGNSPPILRFYTWSPIAISLGHFQRNYPEKWNHLTWQNKPIEIVRRPSGGRAVLHQGDLTYMVVTSGFSSNVATSYEQISQFLLAGWRSLGIELHYGKTGRGYIHNPNCFGTATQADLIDKDGHKIIGGAQLRQGKTILQHGSMLLNPDPDLFAQVFGRFSPHSINLSHEIIIESLITSAEACFGVKLINQPLSETEWQTILNSDFFQSDNQLSENLV